MKIAIMQPYFLPYIGYFQLINAVDKFIILDDVNFIKKGWINRNRIVFEGQEIRFTIPLKKASQNKKICEIEISTDTNWKEKLISTFNQKYGKADSYNKVFPLIKECILSIENNLSTFVTESLKKISNYLGISTEFINTSRNYNIDFLNGQEKIIEICKKENADHYLNLSGGRDLYKNEEFANNNIKLSFMKMNYFEYKRMNQKFVPSLSIVDVLMFNNISSIKDMLNRYTLL
ncbi:MAG: WbqC family protein [Melioribacteraceae bacterium]|nr:WbqC family protein [Melioribacteraceae bacterium]